MIERSIAATIHGRYLTILPAVPEPAPLLVGFHGFAEDAETQLERLRAIPGSERWLIVSIQGLHRFYNRRTNSVVASWMTRQNRDEAIADNIAYVNSCIGAVEGEWGTLPAVIFAGFSQGVAMAFRAAVNSTRPVTAVIAAGGDVPPDVTPDGLKAIPAVLLARGVSDTWYTEEQFHRDAQRLQQCSVYVHALAFNGGHEWPPDLTGAAGQFLETLKPDLQQQNRGDSNQSAVNI